MTARRGRAWTTWVAIGALVLPPLSLLPYATSGTEATRARNALVFEARPLDAFVWTPADPPADFLRDDVPATPAFAALVRRLQLADLPDDWARAVAISRHLMASAPRLSGGPIQQGLEETLHRITEDGDGYCADFVRVFQAIAGAAGMPMRSWAFSFDGFGGHGHVFPEIWNRQRQVWQMLDLFDNVYFADAAGQPLSALALHAALNAGTSRPQVLPLVPEARPGYAIESKLWAYFQAGADEWYLWWGHNPFAYEAAAPVRWLSPVSRAAAQLGAMAAGVQPAPRGIASERNAPQREALVRLKWHVWLAVIVMLAGLAVLVMQVLSRPRRARSQGVAHAR